VLPGPKIAFWPVHHKSSANFGKRSADFTKTSMHRSARGPMEMKINFPFSATFGQIRPKFGHEFFRPILFSSASFEIFCRNFGHLATLANIAELELSDILMPNHCDLFFHI
jgi:hypothetical protein